jgi:hypothetical protein
MRDYDDWKLSSGQDNEKVWCACDHCFGEIYVGEEYYHIEMFGDNVHEDCVVGYLLSSVDRTTKIAGE